MHDILGIFTLQNNYNCSYHSVFMIILPFSHCKIYLQLSYSIHSLFYTLTFIASPDTLQMDALDPDQWLHCRSPSEVCKTCFDKYHGSVWLASLLCTQPEEHRSIERVTVMVDASKTRVVQVCEPPANPASHSSAATRCSQCKRVHSPEELHYWKLQTIHRELERLPEVG